MEKKKKKPYVKPMIKVERFALDSPVASSCMSSADDIGDLMELGYFNETKGCRMMGDDISFGGSEDTICYHANVIEAFTS